MRGTTFDQLLICYVPGLDLRRVGPDCPYVSAVLSAHPWVRLRTLPTTEHVPTIVTGTYPHEHGQWGPSLKPEPADGGAFTRMVDGLPDVVTTTAQGLWHLARGPMDLATMPPRRRRRFHTLRYKFIKLANPRNVLQPVNGICSMFNVLEPRQCTFVYHEDFDTLDQLLDEVNPAAYTLQMLEIHCLDRVQHWQMHDDARIKQYYYGVDRFIRNLHERCQTLGVSFLLLSDHGMELVTNYIDVMDAIHDCAVADQHVDFFIANTRAVFWFHDASTKSKIVQMLAELPNGTLLLREDMARYGMHFADRAFGDAYFYPDPGHSFYPNDFHQPLASAYLALTDRQQRPRLRDPRHRGDHGYLPEAECEAGFLALADQRYTVDQEEASLRDIAPSVLALLGRPSPETMRGRRLFQPRAAA